MLMTKFLVIIRTSWNNKNLSIVSSTFKHRWISLLGKNISKFQFPYKLKDFFAFSIQILHRMENFFMQIRCFSRKTFLLALTALESVKTKVFSEN